MDSGWICGRTRLCSSGAAYGYWFKGLLVHKVRVLIRDSRPPNQQNPPIGPFYWAGAY